MAVSKRTQTTNSWVLTTRDLKSCRPILQISIPSMTIFPSVGSTYKVHGNQLGSVNTMQERRTKRKILIARVDLPLPVLPNNPTRSLAFKENETP